MLFDIAEIVKTGDLQIHVETTTDNVCAFLWYSGAISVEELLFLQAKQPTSKEVKKAFKTRPKYLQNSYDDDQKGRYKTVIENPVSKEILFRLQTHLMKRRDNFGWICSSGRKERRKRVLAICVIWQ